jgi:hypothetical protein
MSIVNESDLRRDFPELPEQLSWIDGPTIESTVTSWWVGPVGTYKANSPQSPSDERVGSQETRRIIGRVRGQHIDLGATRFSSLEEPSTEVEVTRELPPVFFARGR